jgi:hypothetical protein
MSVFAGQGLTDIDSLALAVRDRESRRLIAEAITAYRAGALRSAIMSAWIAVAYDIISKARELAAQGEVAPKTFVDELDNAIATDDIRKLQNIESDILNIANTKLLLLAPHEYNALVRMQKDRNLCAHPAFVVEDTLYQPTPELVRAHIIHALQHLLVHAPLQGKSALVRFEADVLSSSFPASSQDIGIYIRAKYLDRAKDVLVVNLIKSLLVSPFGAERLKFSGKERLLARTLREVAGAKTAIYDDVMPAFVKVRFDGVEDDVLLKLIMFFDVDPRIWTWLSEPVRLRIKALLAVVPLPDLKAVCAFDAFIIPELAQVLMARFDAFDQATQINVITDNPRQEFVHPAINIYGNAGGWREAEGIGRNLIVPLAPLFAAEDVRKVLAAVEGNSQVSEAAGSPAILATIYELTKLTLPDARPHWQEFVDDMTVRQRDDPNAHFAYPGIRALLDAA